MGWKEWPSWLKGGVVSLVVVFISYTLIYLSDSLIQTRASQHLLELTIGASIWFPGILLAFFMIILGMGSLVEEPNILVKTVGVIFILIFNFLFFFIIGAIIGWIIGKIIGKIRNNNNY